MSETGRMPKRLKLYIIGVVATSAFALVATTLLIPLNPAIGPGFGVYGPLVGVFFWIVMTLVASALPVRMPRGATWTVSTATVMAATILGGPTAAAWVGALGPTEIREVRGRIPWYGTLANHAGITLPAVVAGVVFTSLTGTSPTLTDPLVFVVAMVAATLFLAINAMLTALLVALRTSNDVNEIIRTEARGIATSIVGIAPLGWLMAQMYTVAWWASLLFALPLYTTRLAYHNFVEMREMFTQTITALAEAVDKRDPFTSKHSWRVKEIAGDIGRVMHLGVADLEALEWGGLLHDVGKIGVPDSVLLKQERLNREERMMMNAHPVLGAQIIQPVARLSRELPIIRHHHEWYNGSGYPDRLIGDEIPILARILHVADAFEAMTAQRPYRMTPLTAEQALGELRKFAGVQFDPQVVDAFVKTDWVAGVSDPGRTVQPRPIPLISQRADRMATAVAGGVSGGPTTVDPS
jgi:putative nucleotidyltransferase with HDIG domain